MGGCRGGRGSSGEATKVELAAAGEPEEPDRERLRRQPGRGSKAALAAMAAALRTGSLEEAGPPGVGPLGAVVDTVVASRRLAGWALWVELLGLAQLFAFWQESPPIVDESLHRYGEESPDPCAKADPDLADRLHYLVSDWQLPTPANMHELAEPFVTSEISAACGASRRSVGLRLDMA